MSAARCIDAGTLINTSEGNVPTEKSAGVLQLRLRLTRLSLVNGTDESDPDAKAQATRRPGSVSEPVSAKSPGATTGPATLDTASLFAGRSEIRLLHRGQEYRLRVTKQGKLILTK